MAEGVRALADKLGISGVVQRLVSSPLTMFLALVLLPFRMLFGGFHKMREFVGVMIFLGVGVLIAAAVVWYATVVLQWWNASSGPPSIGAVTIVGLDESRTKAVTTALPAMILAELRRIGERTNEAKRQLRELEATDTQQTVPQDPRFAPIPVPESLKTEVAIPQQIGGVEIGWLLTWIKDLLAPTNVIDVTVSFEGESKKVSVFGHAKGKPGYAFYFQDETGRPDEVARAIAASIIQHEQRRGEIAVQPLPLSDYLPVVNVLSTYATFEKVTRSWQGQQGRPDFTEKYKEQLEAIGKIAQTHTQWAELQWLAAEIAERAGDPRRALAFTINEQRLTPRDDPRYGRLAARLARLAETKVASAPPKEREAAREAAGRLPGPEHVAQIKGLMGVPAAPAIQAPARVASILVPWPEAMKAATTKVLREAVNQDEALTDYATITMQMKRTLAPGATYEFAGVQGLRDDEINQALAEIARAKPDVLYYSFSASPAATTALKRLASDTVVVVAAGNERGRSDFAAIDDVALVVGATDLKGLQAPFSSSSARSVWAPGVDIPFVSPGTGELSRGSGTSYSGALVAGAAALLKGAHPKAKPQQIVAALRDTAKPPAPGATPVINVTAALAQLEKSLRAQTSGSN